MAAPARIPFGGEGRTCFAGRGRVSRRDRDTSWTSRRATGSATRRSRTIGATVSSALRGLFADWLEVLQRGVERNIQEPGDWATEHRLDDGAGRFFEDYCSWQRIPEYRDFVLHSPAAALAGRLTGARTIPDLPRPPAGQGAGDHQGDALASRHALLLRRGPAGGELLDRARPRGARHLSAFRGGLAQLGQALLSAAVRRRLRLRLPGRRLRDRAGHRRRLRAHDILSWDLAPATPWRSTS